MICDAGQQTSVSSISLQPGSDGNIFATGDLYYGALRIFDIRRSTSSEMKLFYIQIKLKNAFHLILWQ